MPSRSTPALALLATLGCAQPPSEVAPARDPETTAPWLEEISETLEPTFRHVSGAKGRYLPPEIMGGGAALFDLEGDGDLDLYFVQSGSFDAGERHGNRLWRNDSEGEIRFTDVTEGSGADDAGYGMGVTTGDYDGDGDTDLYVTNVGPNVLLRNDGPDGDGRVTFTDVTAAAGLGDAGWGASAAFLDYDSDGDLDLFVTNYVVWSLEGEQPKCMNFSGLYNYCPPGYDPPQPDVLYRNDGGGTFTDVSVDAGLRAAFGNGLGVVWGDFDGDDAPDVFVANDQMANQLWRGVTRDGVAGFENAAPAAGCAVDAAGRAKAGMGVVSDDFDDDGDLDLLVVNLQSEPDSFYRNEGSYFLDDTPAVGLGTATRGFTRFGVGWVDFDNDGWNDLYMATGRVDLPDHVKRDGSDPFAELNVLLRGTPNGRFEAVATADGTAEPLPFTSRAAAFGDLDNDGGIDVVVVNRDASAHVLRNVVPARGHWIRWRILDRHGADALGASLTLTVGERTLRRDVRVAYSYCAANDPRIHVGLGAATEVKDVRLRWPDGSVEALGDFTAGRDYVIRASGGPAVRGET